MANDAANSSTLNGTMTTTTTKKRVIIYVMVVLLWALTLLHLGSVSRRFNLSSYVSTTSSSFIDHNNSKQNLVIIGSPRVQSKITCDRSHYHYDLCSINGPTILDPTTFTFFSIGLNKPKRFFEKIRPYPRKWENFTMSKIKEVRLFSGPPRASCDIVHNAPALVFSAGGYTGNFFHEFNEGFLPLFITVRSMSSFDRDVVLVIEKARDWWVNKYADLLRAFSKHPIVNLANDTATHCFTSTTVGLISHGFMTIDQKLMPNPTTLTHFHALLDGAYRQAHHTIFENQLGRPKLVLVSRTGIVGRVILNQAEIQTLAVKVGYNVVVFEPKPNTPIGEAYRLMNESHVMVGVHGAAMTHLLFLRPGSIFIQVVPIGTDWVADMCYGKPAKEMGLEYMEYKVRVDESSLINKYNQYDPILKDPMGLQKKGWSLLKKVYLKEQDVNLDLIRFRGYLEKAYRKAKRFMYKAG